MAVWLRLLNSIDLYWSVKYMGLILLLLLLSNGSMGLHGLTLKNSRGQFAARRKVSSHTWISNHLVFLSSERNCSFMIMTYVMENRQACEYLRNTQATHHRSGHYYEYSFFIDDDHTTNNRTTKNDIIILFYQLLE